MVTNEHMYKTFMISSSWWFWRFVHNHCQYSEVFSICGWIAWLQEDQSKGCLFVGSWMNKIACVVLRSTGKSFDMIEIMQIHTFGRDCDVKGLVITFGFCYNAYQFKGLWTFPVFFALSWIFIFFTGASNKVAFFSYSLHWKSWPSWRSVPEPVCSLQWRVSHKRARWAATMRTCIHAFMIVSNYGLFVFCVVDCAVLSMHFGK